MRDTLAGLVRALHPDYKGSWCPPAETLFGQRPTIILWIEQDGREKESHDSLTLTRKIESSLSWLNPYRVMLMNRTRVPPGLDLKPGYVSKRAYNVRKIVNAKTKTNKSQTISRDQFCTAWATKPQDAGMELEKLCNQGFLKRVERKNDLYTAGPHWDRFHE